MHLTFSNPGFDYSVDSILLFHTGEQTALWQEALFHYFPAVSRDRLSALPHDRRGDYLREALAPVYAGAQAEIAEKLEKYNAHWLGHKESVTEAFSAAFGCDFSSRLNGVTGNITLNPVCPRFLDTATFDVFYLNSQRGALGIALHEMIHFAWFEVWHAHFGDDAAQYDIPHLKWIFSEMAVDAIMRRDARLSAINPYFAAKDHIYDCFFQMRLGGERALDALHAAYCRMPITDFMEWGLAYCRRYEADIRAQMTEYL